MIDNQTVLAIIPVRGGSKGVPRKNIRPIAGISLLARTIETAKLSLYIDKLIVTSDDNELIAEARRYGAEVPFVRPAELAQDDTPGISPILHALENYPVMDNILLLQATSPLRTVTDIDQCIELCHKSNAPACVSVTDVEHHPYLMYQLINDTQLNPICSDKTIYRRQDLPPVVRLNGAIYYANSSWLLENKDFISSKTVAYTMPNNRSLDIDTEEDFLFFENLCISPKPTI